MISFWAFRDILLFKKLYIFLDVGSDSFYIGLPHLIYISDLLKSGTIPLWSSGVGIGQSTLVFNHTIFDPFNWILFASPEDKILLILGYVVFLKSLVAAGIFFALCRKLNLGLFTSIVGGVIYGLNGYLILWGQHYSFALATIYFPLLLLGIEFWICDRKAPLLIATVFLVAIWSPYFLYMMSIFLFPYFFMRVYIQDALSSRKIRYFFEFAALYLLGIGMAAFVFVPSIFLLLESPRVGAGFASPPFLMQPEYYISLLSRFFSNHFKLGAHHFYDWWNIYELPNVYCSSLALLLLPLAWLDFPERKNFFLYWTAAALVFAFIFPIFGLFANAFSYVSYRWTFVIIPIMLLFSLRGLEYLDKAKKPPVSFLLFSYLGLALILISVTMISSLIFGWVDVSFNDQLIAVSSTLAFIGLFTINLILVSHKKWKNIGKVGLLSVLVFELGSHVSSDVHDRALLSPDYPSKKIGVFDLSKDIVKEIKDKQKDFFRVIKTTSHVSFNDPIAQGYFGTSSYEPLNSRGTLDFLKTMDVYSPNRNYTKISPDRLLLNSFLAVRYQILDNSNDVITGYNFIRKKGNLSVYENTNFLPLGLIFDQYTELSNFLKLPSFERDRAILKAVVVNDNSILKDGLRKVEINAVNLSSANEIKLNLPANFINMNVKDDNFPLNLEFDTKFNDPYILVKTLLPHSGLLKISFTFDTSKDATGQVYWRFGDDSFKIDKAQYFPIKKGINSYSLDLGYVDKIDRLRIELSNTPGQFKISNFKAEITPTLALGEYKKDIETLRSKSMVISRWNDSRIEGVVNLIQSGILVMQIPIAPGWYAKVDGIPVKIEPVNGGLIGLPISQGKHKVILTYKPPFMTLGIYITAISWIGMILWFVRRRFLFD